MTRSHAALCQYFNLREVRVHIERNVDLERAQLCAAPPARIIRRRASVAVEHRVARDELVQVVHAVNRNQLGLHQYPINEMLNDAMEQQPRAINEIECMQNAPNEQPLAMNNMPNDNLEELALAANGMEHAQNVPNNSPAQFMQEIQSDQQQETNMPMEIFEHLERAVNILERERNAPIESQVQHIDEGQANNEQNHLHDDLLQNVRQDHEEYWSADEFNVVTDDEDEDDDGDEDDDNGHQPSPKIINNPPPRNQGENELAFYDDPMPGANRGGPDAEGHPMAHDLLANDPQDFLEVFQDINDA